jgi:hypothetical protein
MSPLLCFTCLIPVEPMGTKRFHEGTRWGVLGQLGELLINRMHFDMYYCPRCGRVSAFVENIGRELRGAVPSHESAL